MRWLTDRLTRAVIVEPRQARVDIVFFGAIVEVEDEDGTRATYRIVGEDEIDIDRGHVSWRSLSGAHCSSAQKGIRFAFIDRRSLTPELHPPTR